MAVFYRLMLLIIVLTCGITYCSLFSVLNELLISWAESLSVCG